MEFMKWKKEFETGIPEMDEQHQRWLALLNIFYDQISQKKDIDQELRKLVSDVLEYTNYHFREEERLMTKMGYPELAKQKEMHNQITKKVTDFKKKVDSGQRIVSIELTKELRSWFNEHILVEDKKYAKLYLSKS